MGVASHEQFGTYSSRRNIQTDISSSLKLFKNDFTPTLTSSISDFTEADFSGYDDEGFGQSDFSNGSLNRHEKQAGVKVFIHNGGTTSNTIYGWYIVGGVTLDANGDTIGTELVAFEKFASPVDMDTEFDRIEITIASNIEMLP